MRVAHLAVDHPPFNARIFHKECVSLADAGHEVHLLVPNAPGGERRGVHLRPLEPPGGGGRARRLWRLWRNVYRCARDVRADVYHLHEPKLIPVGLALKRAGATVVYDVHEDTPREKMAFAAGRPGRAAARFLTWTAVERLARLRFDGFVCATETIARRFPADRTVAVRNYPIWSADGSPSAVWEPPAYDARPPAAIYAGGLTRIRGVEEMVEAVARIPPRLDARLLLYGAFDSDELAAGIAARPGWQRTRWFGWRPHEEVVAALHRARAGLALLHPVRIYLDSLPTKLFEYMAAGLPVIASDFPAWRPIVHDHRCGLLVDPTDPEAIAGALRRILEHPAEAAAMGRRGLAAARQCYDWRAEARKLLGLYQMLAGRRARPGRIREPAPEDLP